MDNFRPNPNFIPPKIVLGGVERNSPAGKHFHHVLITIYQIWNVARMDLKKWNESTLLWSPGPTSNFDPRPLLSKGERKSAAEFISDVIQFLCTFRCHRFSCALVLGFVFIWFVVGVVVCCYVVSVRTLGCASIYTYVTDLGFGIGEGYFSALTILSL